MSHNSCGLCSVELQGIKIAQGKEIFVHDINLKFNCGELTALIGRNGAGKTTLLKAILGERSYEGELFFVDHNGNKMKNPRIGYVPQQMDFDRSIPISVEDFMISAKGGIPVWFGQKKEKKTEIYKNLERMNCGYLLKSKLGNLSGGELQRVLLALATEPIPDLLILDEPVSGVDMAGLDLFYKEVTRLRDEYHMAILLVSHDLNLIGEYADKVILLDKTVVAWDTPKDVFDTEAFKDAFGYLHVMKFKEER